MTGAASAADGWEAVVKVKTGVAEGKLRIGMRSDATDGVDNRYEVPAYIAGNEALLAYTAIGSGKYWRDIKAVCSETCKKDWHLVIESTQTGKSVVITWDPASLPQDMNMNLIDSLTGNTIDMKVKTELQYDSHGKREFTIEATR